MRLELLGTRKLTWLDLRAVVRHAPPGNALDRSLNPTSAMWSFDGYLLATIANLLAVGNWQRGGDETAPRPKPILPPGVEDPSTDGFGSGAIPMSQFDEWWETTST